MSEVEVEGFSDLERIGSGGLGDVFRATRSSTGATVAIKVLRDVSDSSVAWHRTRRELTALVSLSGHGHVVQLIELLDLTVGPALVMEYAPGGSVADVLTRRDGTLPVAEVVMIGRQAAAALAAAHEQHIVHRDLKPQNLLVDAYGQVKLCDFGIASLARSEEFRTRTTALSMRYASPEDLDDDGDITSASDVYSLGATLLHLLHGAPPTLRDRLAPWVPPPTDDPDVAALDAVIADCLQPMPSRRPTALRVIDRLETIDATLPDRCRALPVESEPEPEHVAGPFEQSGRAGEVGDTDDPRSRAEGGARAAGRAWWFGGLDADTSAATVARADRVASSIPRQTTTDGRRRSPWSWAVLAVASAAGLGVGAALWWPPGEHQAASRPTVPPPVLDEAVEDSSASMTGSTPSTAPVVADPVVPVVVDRPDGLPSLDLGAAIWPFGEPGGCLVQVNGVDELMPVDCGEPHDLQRVAVVELDTVDFPLDAAFSAEAVRVTTDDVCREAFAVFVGVTSSESIFDIAITRPSRHSWDAADRRYQCLLGVPGSHVVGDAADSAR